MLILDAKTEYSFMRGFGSAEQWLARAKAVGASAFGIADYCSTWGHVPFQKVFDGSDIKLLYGVQLPVVNELLKDPRHGLVTLIALDQQGFTLLNQCVSTAHQQTYYRPRITWRQIKELEGVAIILNEGTMSDLVSLDDLDHGFLGAGVNPGLYKGAVESDEYFTIAALSPKYPTIDDREGFELVQAISSGQRFGEVETDTVHMLQEKEYISLMESRYAKQDAKEYISTAETLAKFCEVVVPQATNIKPVASASLHVLVKRGATQRGIKRNTPRYSEYKARLEYELGIIAEKDFEDYFIFVADIVSWAKSRMFVGPARGSSGGSLVCYCLGITELDPIKFGTLFERFIDITRSDWPDIDVDFPDDRREEVFDYLKETYGADRVARLGTTSKFQGKSAINDVGRATGVPFQTSREVNRFVEQASTVAKTVKLADLFNRDLPDLKALLAEAPSLQKATLLDGHVRHHGKHAAGVVVTNEPISQYGVVDRDGVLSMDMKSAESVNLLKVDVLGLRTLSIIQDCCDQIDMDPRKLYDIDFDNPEVMEVFNNNNVTGIFQFEGVAVRSLMKQVEVEKFDDLCALMSLARPGPLAGGAAAAWVQRRSGLVDWDYLHPALETHTKETYGTIVYQEQAMNIVRDIGGFDVADVNKFRRAMGKKNYDALQGYEQRFISNARKVFSQTIFIANEGDKLWSPDEFEIHVISIAQQLWEEMCEFGAYAFNYSHAASYSMLSFMCAYLKKYHPLQYALSCLRHAADDEQGKNILRELSAEGYAYMPFSPDCSEVGWSVQGEILYGGFTSVRGVGLKTAERFVSLREASPNDWMEKLTESQRGKLLEKYNTPWHDLNRMGTQYAELYKSPEKFNIKGPILPINEIPGQKGNYCFIGKLTKRQLRDLNDPHYLAKRKGERFEKNSFFLNLFFEDDTGDVGCTVNRWKYPKFEWINEASWEGKDFLVRGNIINDDGRVWIFIENIKELDDDYACADS